MYCGAIHVRTMRQATRSARGGHLDTAVAYTEQNALPARGNRENSLDQFLGYLNDQSQFTHNRGKIGSGAILKFGSRGSPHVSRAS